MRQQRLYRDLARLHDVLYRAKDYRGEAARVAGLVARSKRTPGRRLLEVACGTGEHLRHLARRFEVEGTDLNEGMLAVARAKLPGVAFVRADMAGLALGRRFDAIVCLYSSIGYLRTEARLARALHAFARHLEPGGVLVIEPWFTPASFRPGPYRQSLTGPGGLRIDRQGAARREGALSVLEFTLRIREPGRRPRRVRDRHVLGLFETGRILELLREAGFKARFTTRGLLENRGLLIGVREPGAAGPTAGAGAGRPGRARARSRAR